MTDTNHPGLRGTFTPPKIVLPKVEWVDIKGNQNLFDALDLRGSRIHSFQATALPGTVKINLSSFRDKLAEISLSSFEWTQKPTRPRHFKDLTYLNLESTRIHGTLGEYLHLPKLRYLGLAKVSFKRSGDTGVQNYSWTRLFSDERFLQGSPLLDTIDLSNQDLDENIVKGLNPCTVLKTFTLSHCNLDSFVSPFLEHLENSELVPSLDTLDIWGSWPTDIDITFEGFSERFMAKRPNVHLSNYD
jgi:hypothetical protein